MLNQQNRDSGKVNEGKKRVVGLVIAGGDTAEPLDFLKKAFDQVALFVEPLVVVPGLING